ncbi:hypothetical protein PINS_up003666 [Pythium insidiosum]|nr:hypothetical protein PINS_up003666 [Pythium insidiosum]
MAETSSTGASPRQVCMQIIRKMLMADDQRAELSINAATATMLNDDDACATLLSYITRIDGHDVEHEPILNGPAVEDAETTAVLRRRDDEDEGVTPELLASYRATMLLTNEDSSEAVIFAMPFLAKKSKLIAKCVFPIFQQNSRGNLRHGCRVIDRLLRLHLDDVYDVVGSTTATVKRYMGAMLQYIEHAPVAEVFLTLICKPHNAALMRYYTSSPQKKWQLFRALSEWKVLLVLAEHVYGTDYSEDHNIGAADVFIELLDRLSADENGALLLQPVAHCPQLLEGLIDTAVDNQRSQGQRTAAMRCVLRLLQRSTQEKVQGPPTSPYQSFGATIVNLVPNQLASLRENVFELAEQHMHKMLQYLVEKYQDQQNIEMDLTSGKPLPEGAVRHTAYVVKVPFTEFRLTLVDALVEIIAHNPVKMTEHFDVNVWRVLVAWFFEYSHTNLYHAAFYQLVFIALRSDDQATLEILVKKLKLVTSLIEHYRTDPAGKTSNKGYILQCCNAIRLQAASQPPDAFLRNFLSSHTTWRSFEAELRDHTSRLCVQGLGFNVPQAMRPMGYQKDTWQLMDEVVDDGGIDHGSEYARSLGFVDDMAWPDDHDASESSGKKKKKKKKGKKKSNGIANGDGDDDDAHTASENGETVDVKTSIAEEDAHVEPTTQETAQSGTAISKSKKKKKSKGKK